MGCLKFSQNRFAVPGQTNTPPGSLLKGLAVQCDVETDDFVLVANAEWNAGVDYFEDYEGRTTRPNYGDNDTVELRDDLLRIALEQAGDTARQLRSRRKRADRKDAGKQGTGKSADAVHAKHI